MSALAKTNGVPADSTIQWLLEGDPAIRWQVFRDLVNASKSVERERNKIARRGWGADLLARQDPEGTWANGLYTPKWTSTTYTMLLLRDFGLSAGNRSAKRACHLLLDKGFQRDGGINYGTWAKWTQRSETCITGMILSILCHFEYEDARLDTLIEHLLTEQMSDGGWNCRRHQGATHASVHTTISVLEGLQLYELYRGRNRKEVRAAQKRGCEFLLVHRLFRSDRTGQVIKPIFKRFSFPARWHYDILRALDFFRAIDFAGDPRLAEAVEIVRASRGPDGRWPLHNRYNGKTFFELERVGQPSRWNTLRALRVLAWWDGATANH